jgi:amidohydrolase
LAAVDRFRVEIIGRQSHGAEPHHGIDPIVIAAQAIGALQTIRSRTLPPLEPSVVTVGVVRGGTRWNIIPERVELEGTVRTYSDAAQALAERRVREILDGITRAGGAAFELEYERLTPVTINDPALTEELARPLARLLGAERVHRAEPLTAGEDFAYFANAIPGFMFLLGTTPPGGSSGGLHTPTFVADDESVRVGMRVMSGLVLDFLRARAPRDN